MIYGAGMKNTFLNFPALSFKPVGRRYLTAAAGSCWLVAPTLGPAALQPFFSHKPPPPLLTRVICCSSILLTSHSTELGGAGTERSETIDRGRHYSFLSASSACWVCGSPPSDQPASSSAPVKAQASLTVITAAVV